MSQLILVFINDDVVAPVPEVILVICEIDKIASRSIAVLTKIGL